MRFCYIILFILLNKMNLDQLKTKGYIIIKKFYTIDEIIKMRKIILYNMKVRKNMLILGSNNSGSKPNFLNDTNYSSLIPLLKLNDIHKIMSDVFNAPFHLCFHNDIGLNRIVNWHKDTLNNQYKHYQKTDIWSEYEGEKHEIYKFLIYLEDHSFDNNGLCLIEESHLERNININYDKQKYMHNQIGDIIIFDQRITHRGQQNNLGKIDRILISIGFGKNNIFTKEFEEGTIKRQNDQNRMIIHS